MFKHLFYCYCCKKRVFMTSQAKEKSKIMQLDENPLLKELNAILGK